MEIDAEKHLNSGKAEQETDDDIVDYDLMVATFSRWIDQQPTDKPAPLNDITDRMHDMIVAGASDLVRDQVIDVVLLHWPRMKSTGLRTEWNNMRDSIDGAQSSSDQPSIEADAPTARPLVEILEPWETPVDPLELARDIRNQLTRHVVFDDPEIDPDVVTLWVLASCHMDAWYIFAKLLIKSPTKRCGKTTLMRAIRTCALRAFMTADPTKSTFFRIIDACAPTFILDEADRFFQGEHEIGGIINAGHTRDTALVPRTEQIDDEWVVTGFLVWCGQVFGGIGSKWISDTLADRSIIVHLTRKRPNQKARKLTARAFDDAEPLRRKLTRWANDTADIVAQAATDNPDPLDGRSDNDRATDNWTPLFHIAEQIRGDWPQRFSKAFAHYAMIGDGRDVDQTVQLLLDMEQLLDTPETQKAGIRNTSKLVAELNRIETSPWGEFRNGQGITAQAVARMLSDFGVQPKRIKHRGKAVRGYAPADITEALNPYRPADAEK